MSLILNDPKKYIELLKIMAKEEEEMQAQSLNKIKNAKDDEYLAGLKWIGVVLGQIRLNKHYTLRKFVMAKFKGDEESASRISNIERGLDIPSADIIKKYVELLEEDAVVTCSGTGTCQDVG